MTFALGGIKIIDLGRFEASPVASQLLADMGADVIKVESPKVGDKGRIVQPSAKTKGGLNPLFEAKNRNKRSITLDFMKEEGKGILYRLVDWADVFSHNYRPGFLDSHGLGYESLIKRNPRLIYHSAYGYGPKGALSQKPIYDTVAQAWAGVVSVSGMKGSRHVPLGVTIADNTTGILGALGILTALFAREKTGYGQHVEVSLLQGQITLQSWPIMDYLLTGVGIPRWGRGTIWKRHLRAYFECKDRKTIAVTAIGVDAMKRLMRAVAVNLNDDPRFVSEESIKSHQEELMSLLDEVFLEKTRDEWMKVLDDYDIPHAPVQTHDEVVRHPQVIENNYIEDFNHPELGPMKVIGMPFTLSETPGKVRRPAPRLGQHTDEILEEFGYGRREITSFRQKGIV
jgi:CoA:oxalate CoA-transferase